MPDIINISADQSCCYTGEERILMSNVRRNGRAFMKYETITGKDCLFSLPYQSSININICYIVKLLHSLVNGICSIQSWTDIDEQVNIHIRFHLFDAKYTLKMFLYNIYWKDKRHSWSRSFVALARLWIFSWWNFDFLPSSVLNG